ncbi:MAG TPA: hypothetical protein ENM97_08280 [Moorella mulderi]|nr:hypothetical protein [Moorella mulderi]
MDWEAGDIIAFLRWQRHDYLNHLQVISGYLQLGKAEQALAYLQGVLKEMEELGKLMRLKSPSLALSK